MEAFWKAVLAGTLAGASLPATLLALGVYATGERGLPLLGGSAVYMAIVFAVTFAVVLSASVLAGLPISIFLRSAQLESRITYALIGAFLGASIIYALCALSGVRVSQDLPGTVVLVGLGFFSGGVTGSVWGSDRVAKRN
jgi:hypothetical protein